MAIRPRVTVSSGQGIARKLQQLKERLATNQEAAIGLPADAGTHPDAGMSYARLGAIHEFGSPSAGIPERSFLRAPLRAAQDELAGHFREMMPLVAQGEMTMQQALDAIGAKAAAVSQEAIGAGIPPANSDETARRKGSSKPLVDTGALRQAITWVVRERGI